MAKHLIIFSLLLTIQVSAMTDYEDLIAWRNIPVAALDTHPFWKSLRLIKANNPEGEEMRIYVNKAERGAKGLWKKAESLSYIDSNYSNPCLKNFKGTYPELQNYLKCSKTLDGCDNIFIIRNGLVQSYIPVGFCMTSTKLRPSEEFKKTMLQ